MVEVCVHSPGFLWLLAVVLFLEIEFQLLVKLKKIAASTEMPQRGLLPPKLTCSFLSELKQSTVYFPVPLFNFLANNVSGVFLTDV